MTFDVTQFSETDHIDKGIEVGNLSERKTVMVYYWWSLQKAWWQTGISPDCRHEFMHRMIKIHIMSSQESMISIDFKPKCKWKVGYGIDLTDIIDIKIR